MGSSVLLKDIKYQEIRKGYPMAITIRISRPQRYDFSCDSPFIHDQVHQNASSEVNDFSIDPCSRLRIVFDAAIPQSLNLRVAERNALEVLWEDSTRSCCLVSLLERSLSLYTYLR